MKPNPTIEIGHRVSLNPNISHFHYGTTPRFSLEYVLKKLQNDKTIGIVRRANNNTESLGVQFPNMKEILWFKPFELEVKSYAISFKQVRHK